MCIRDRKKWRPDLQKRTTAYHAMVVVGYENKGRDSEFELLNSHGPYWGNDGYIKINYEAYAQLVKYAFVIDSVGAFPYKIGMDLPQEELKFPLGRSATSPNDLPTTSPSDLTEIKLQRIEYQANDSPIFVPSPFKYNPEERCYQAQDTWEQYDQYQLIAKNLFTGRRLYVFSFDARQRVIPIWPSGYPKEKQYTEITIPSERSALALSHVGKDYLVLLYSIGELADFDDRLGIFKSLKGTFEKRLQAAFGEVLIEKQLVNYTPDQLQFRGASPKAAQSVIPLIITFDVQAEGGKD